MSFLDKIKKNLGQAESSPAAAGPSAPLPLGADSSQRLESSIISEATPTELAPTEFPETSTAFAASTVSAESPRPAEPAKNRRQGVLTALVAIGLVGTAATVSFLLVNANRSAAQVRSAVLIPIRDRGLLAIGSHDPNRFHPGMGTIFLKLIADAVDVALGRFDAAA